MRRDHMFFARDGEFHYIDWGGVGVPAHFAHATGFCAGVYTPLMERLVPRLRVLGMDDRGHGKTKAPADPRDLRDWQVFSEDLERFFESLQEPVVAMGHSRGAVTSLMVAVRRPEMVRALVLIDPTILPLSWMPGWFLAKKTGLARLVPIAARAAARRRLWPDRKAVLESYAAKRPFKDWADGFLEAYVNEGTKETLDGGITLRCDPMWESACFCACPHDVWRQVSKIQVPTLVIFGVRSDTFLRPAVKRFRKTVPQAEFMPMEGTGHFAPMEKPEKCVGIILDFLDDRGIL